jgi:hypothetical protein
MPLLTKRYSVKTNSMTSLRNDYLRNDSLDHFVRDYFKLVASYIVKYQALWKWLSLISSVVGSVEA